SEDGIRDFHVTGVQTCALPICSEYMNYFKKILRFAIPYKKYGFLNIFFNILYALFSSLSFLALIPMLDVLFGQSKPITVQPNLDKIGNIKDYIFDSLSYWVTIYAGDDKMKALVLVIALVVSL